MYLNTGYIKANLDEIKDIERREKISQLLNMMNYPTHIFMVLSSIAIIVARNKKPSFFLALSPLYVTGLYWRDIFQNQLNIEIIKELEKDETFFDQNKHIQAYLNNYLMY